MDRYEVLLGRVVEVETELQILTAEREGGISSEALIERIGFVEDKLRDLKQDLICESISDSVARADDTRRFDWTPAMLQNVDEQLAQEAHISGSAFRVRNIRRVHNQETGGVDEVTEWEGQGGRIVTGIRHAHKPSMEFKVGKTIMSILASVLILCSMILFGSLLYPYLSDGMKVVIMYAASTAFIVVGLFGRDRKYKTFFTALAGCGVGAFYLSGIISYFVFQVFGIFTLFVLTYSWICVVGWISCQKVPIFAYICYVGILISTALCVFQFEGSLVALGCYLLSIVTLYLFNRTQDYRKDAFYFVQLPLVLLALAFCYGESPMVVMWIMYLCGVVYIVQHYLYKEKSKLYVFCMFVTQLVMFTCYKVCCDSSSPWAFLNITYATLTGLVSVWSYLTFQDKILKVGPLCVMSLLLPVLEYGSWYKDYVGFAPFAMAILVIGYILGVDIMKGIACGFMLYSMIDPPYALGDIQFYLLLVVFMIEFGVLFGTLARGRHMDMAGFMVISCATLFTLVMRGTTPVVMLAYVAAVAFGALFSSSYFAVDDFSQRAAWAWLCFWIPYGFGLITMTSTSDVFPLVVYFLALLVMIMLNVRWQLTCNNIVADFELCAKWSLYIFAVLAKLQASGVVMSVAFLLLSIWCIVLGAMIRHKIVRLYGLVLSIVSVVKCLLIDIQYSSSLYRPVGLFVAGLLCFGISWLYSVIEKKLRDE